MRMPSVMTRNRAARSDPSLESNLVSDFLAEFRAGLLRDSRRGGASRHAAGLEHDQVGMVGREQAGFENRRGYTGGFAGAGRGDEDE